MPGPAFLSEGAFSLHPVELTDDDVGLIQQSINDPETRRSMGLRRPFDETQERDWLEETNQRDDHYLFFVCVDTEPQPVGNVELFDIDPVNGRAELGCWIYRGHRKNGYGTAACELLVEYAFDELRLHRLDAVANESNSASQALLEALGFVHEGTVREAVFLDGEYVDIYQYGRLATDK